MKLCNKAKATWVTLFIILLVPVFLAGCEGDRGIVGLTGSTGATGEQGPQGVINAVLEETQDLPGINIEVVSLSGGSGTGGAFNAGDTVAVTFNLTFDDDDAMPITELDSGSILVSGPTSNYQRVLQRQRDLATAAVKNSDGTYTYTFTDPIPAVYDAPYNDTTSFGIADGELQGSALLDGTYTVGMFVYKNYEILGNRQRDVGVQTYDFLIGAATTIAVREVVKDDNCNQCHVELQFHGGTRRNTNLCILCHTSGAEDRNDLEKEGGTPDVSIDFRVMIHKIHNAKHLPSVLGVSTNADGSRKYDATPKPLTYVGFSTAELSEIAFPVWPNMSHPMPRDAGYSDLTDAQQDLEDEMRRGVTQCSKCHGDPDGDGPLTAPAQGDLIFSQPSRNACGSCHDDIDWTKPYVSNDQTMLANQTDADCLTCHPKTGSQIAIQEAHLHPMVDAALSTGINVVITSVDEAGSHNSNGNIDPGEKISLSFTIKDDAGADIDPASLSRNIDTVVTGPVSNRNMLISTSMPRTGLATSGTQTRLVPEIVLLEFIGDSTGEADALTASRTPFWDSKGGTTTVRERTATAGGDTTLSAAPAAVQVFVDVADATDFGADDYVVIDDGVAGKEEYRQIASVDGKRIWFKTSGYSYSLRAGLAFSHDNAATVKEVTLTSKTLTTDYTLDESTGGVTLVAGQFTNTNAVIVTYTTDYVLPSVYTEALNTSPGFDETWGKWSGKAIVDGTYTVGMWGRKSITVDEFSESQNYNIVSHLGSKDFLVGDTITTLNTTRIISSASNCNACHTDIWFHGGGRRGFDTCIQCHGTAGAEDRAFYRYGGQETADVTVEFRQMLHKIHMGKELTKAKTYTVMGFGNPPSAHTYEEVGFPPWPGGVKHCDKCHGAGSDSWKEPAIREHTDDTVLPVRTWRTACTSCHDADAVAAHANQQTDANGVESCSVCHGAGKEFAVDLKHKNR